MLRNEADIIETNLRHHFVSVIDEAIVIDNGSTDGTIEVVSELAEDLPILLASEVGPMYQSDRVTRMARFAVRRGADWVLPIDADEFWVATGASFRGVLEDTPTEVGALFVELVTFVQSRDVLAARPGCLASMTMRPEHQVGPMEELPRLVQDEEVGWVEIMYTPKCVHRARPGITVPKGNHRTGVPDGRPTDRITCLHAPMRAFSTLDRQARPRAAGARGERARSRRGVVARQALVADGTGAHTRPRVGGAQLPRWRHHRRRPAPRARRGQPVA